MIYEADFVLHTRIIFYYRDINMALTSFENSVYLTNRNLSVYQTGPADLMQIDTPQRMYRRSSWDSQLT
jgi:hypothetical protein